MGDISTNDSLYAACIDPPAFDLSTAQLFGSPDRSALLKHLVLDFSPVDLLSSIPNFTSWLDSVVDYLSTFDVHYLDAPRSFQ